MTRFAANTSVPVARSKAEIETILERYGAEQFMSGWNADCAVIGFTIRIDADQIRQIRFNLPMPDKMAKRFTTRNITVSRNGRILHRGKRIGLHIANGNPPPQS